MPFSRRSFLRAAATSAALMAAPFLHRPIGLGWAANQGQVGFPSSDWTVVTVADWAAGEIDGVTLLPDGGIALVAGAAGRYRSAIHETPVQAEAAGLRWLATGPAEGVGLRLRSSDDGRTWGEWQPVPVLDHGPLASAAEPGTPSELVSAAGRFQQFEVELRAIGDQRPTVRQVVVRSIATTGPGLLQAAAAAQAPIGALAESGNPTPAPRIIARRDWGCPEPNSSPRWPPNYREAVKFFVHHTATTNEDRNPPATVRAIWHYHAVTLDWGDIGYNYLIDRYGNIYEGRYGGDNVIAGHALCYNTGSIGIALLGDFATVDSPDPMIEALVTLIAWKAYQRRIHPLKSTYFVNRILANISCHRDGNDACGFRTTCPGDRLVARLPQIREAVWSRFAPYALAWEGNATPDRLATGQKVTVPVDVTNLGRLTWTTTDPATFRLGYHWYHSDGSQYFQPPEEDLRTSLPRPLEFGDRAQFEGQLQAPRQPGTYTLKWDIVHEGSTWLAARGNPELTKAVEVYEASPYHGVAWGAHQTPRLLLPGETVTVRIDLQNTGPSPWRAAGENNVRLGYRWYRPDGSQYLQSPEDDRRTHLPRDIAPGEWVSLTAQLMAPRDIGAYTLKWDVVQEGVAWFSQRGASTLDVSIDVATARRGLYLPAIGRGR